MSEVFLRPAFLAPLALLTSYLIYMIRQVIRPSNLPNFPVAGSKASDWFPLLQARWRNSTNYGAVADEINTLYKDQPCLVPIGGSETVVLLPASETQHIADQPDAVLNMPQPMIQGLQFKYTVADQIIIEKPIHQKIVASNLTHQVSHLMSDVLDETEWGFRKHWGTDTTGFKDVVVFETMRRIIGIVTNRVFVGLPSCRNPALVDAGMSYARALPEEARYLRMYPNFVKPLVAPLYTKKTKAHTKDFYNILMPEIQRRLREYELYQSKPEKQGLEPDHNDFLQWSIAQAKTQDDPRMAKPSTLAGRVLMLNFGAIHTTSFTITHAIFDLFSSKQEYVDELREEISSALIEHGGKWTKKALVQMEKLDSIVRESLRLNMVSTFGVPRLVVGRDGFTTRSGLRIPKGNIVAVPGKNIAKDEKCYPNADTYKPFRFAEKRADEEVEYVKRARQAAPTTSPEFLPFGHGKHACPGRFFAASELKLILGYMVMNYDIEMLDERPADIYAGPARLPPMAATVRVRRRKDTA
ncbi:cytochrome P450 [Xylariales sp. AK1849]|nr:cytochrome P450 [Xylariales sp. AK1849]